MVQVVNRELMIFCLQAIAEKEPNTMKASTLIEALSAFQAGIELVEKKEEREYRKLVYKVGNMVFEVYCIVADYIDKIYLYEKVNKQVFYFNFPIGLFEEAVFCPDCLK